MARVLPGCSLPRVGSRKKLPALYALLAVGSFLAWTVAPLTFEAFSPSWLLAADDFGGNLLALVAIGWLLCNALDSVWRSVMVIAVVSMGVELLQSFVPSREGGIFDVLANTAGAWGGALWRVRRAPAPGAADGLLVCVTLWTIASRIGAPGAPVVAVILLSALGVAAVGAASVDRVAFLLLGVGATCGLSPTRLVIAVMAGWLVGVVAHAHVNRNRALLACVALVAFVVQRWPLGTSTARPMDPPVAHAEWAMVAATTALLVRSSWVARSARAT